jgi:hypothetical protein
VRTIAAGWLAGLLFLAGPTLASTYYVAPGGDDSGDGSLGDPWASFARAGTQMAPGDTLFLRGGTYTETLAPSVSGTPDERLVFARYQGEEPILTGVQYCVDLRGRSFVVIDGITCDGMDIRPNATVEVGAVIWSLPGSEASHNIIRNSTFRQLMDVGIAMSSSHHNEIRDNVLEYFGNAELRGGGEAIVLSTDAHHNLIEGNVASFADHNIVQMRFSAHSNIVRDNVFRNPWWKVFGLFGEETRRNVIEGNRVFEVSVPPGWTDESPGAIQLKAPENVFRHNLFYDNVGPGILSNASVDATRVDHNKIYHNVFYRNGSAAWLHENSFGNFVGFTDSNVFLNNIAYKNTYSHFLDLDLGGGQIDFELNTNDLNDNLFLHNDIMDDQLGEVVISVTGIRQAPLVWWETNHPESFVGNIEGDPRFVDEAGADFELRANSPCIDAGAFPTVTRDAGSGQRVPVEDASYFSDGRDLVAGDPLQLEGDSERATVCHVDLFTNTISVDRPLAWSVGQGVALAYEGLAPDLGAFEFRADGSIPEDLCPPLPACDDGLDNDGDGPFDFPDDPGCSTPSDPLEGAIPVSCGNGGLEIVLILAGLLRLRTARRCRS